MTMMSCREVAAKTSDYINNDVSWRDRIEIRVHLLMCRLCRRYVSQVAGTVRLLRSLRRDNPPVSEAGTDTIAAAARDLFRSSRPQ